ncbi:MAG: F0F1 ATP synthase subunit B [Gammaproteobacteria bacterium]|nr:F0F1 ATP synthase subunit B [Gammaproteobacteria bacterium]
MTISVTLIVQMVGFALLIFFVNRVLWGPLTAMMARRQKRIADGLAAAEEGRRALDRAHEQEEEILKLARERAAEILDHAERRARGLVDEARERAQQEGEQMIALLRAEAATERTRMREALRHDVARLALLGAERVVQREVDARLHEDLLQQVMEQL